MMYTSEFILKHVDLAFGNSLDLSGRKMADLPVYESCEQLGMSTKSMIGAISLIWKACVNQRGILRVQDCRLLPVIAVDYGLLDFYWIFPLNV